MYYNNKIRYLEKLFGPDIKYQNDKIIINGETYEIKNDVIVFDNVSTKNSKKKIIESFQDEWFEFSMITKEHYFLIDFFHQLVQI